MKFMLGSTNAHKAEELKELLSSASIEIVAASSKLEVTEDGSTFQENALKKAKAYYDEFKVPVVADDSGLVLPSIPEILGIYSARFAPEMESYQKKNLYLIELLNENKKDRKAYFVCYLCFYFSEDEVYFFEGRVHGQIGDIAKGADGFGYDPIFFPDGQNGKSMAEIPKWKMKNSHRAKACQEAALFLKNKFAK